MEDSSVDESLDSSSPSSCIARRRATARRVGSAMAREDERARLLARDVERAREMTTTTTTTRRTKAIGANDDEGEREDEGWRRANARRRVLTLVAALALAFVALVCARSPSRASMRMKQSASEVAKSEYGGVGALGELKWSARGGFELSGYDADAHGHARVRGVGELLENTIMRYYPERVKEDSEPFSVLFTSSDLPKTPCANEAYAAKRCHFDEWAPIFAFGSAPKNASILPPVIGSTSINLISCFDSKLNVRPQERGENPKIGEKDEPTCDFLMYPKVKYSAQIGSCEGEKANTGDCRYHGLFSVDGVDDEEKSQYAWENLKPAAIWRGSDYHFLDKSYPGFKYESYSFLKKLERSDRKAEMQALIDGDVIGPRLRAVLTSLAKPKLIDARFFVATKGNDRRSRLGEELGVDAYEHLEENDFAKYRYQLDLGGGGGTTWSGVLPRLSMPGVLLHHETATKDSYFDLLKPWVHYIPISEDIKDLEARIAWAEEHQDEAKKISAHANAFVRDFRRLRSLLRHNYDRLAVPLAKVLDPNDLGLLIPFDVAHPK